MMTSYWYTVSFLLFFGYPGSSRAYDESGMILDFSPDLEQQDIVYHQEIHIECECYNTTKCENSTLKHFGRKKCYPTESSPEPCCFVAWELNKSTNNLRIAAKDCWYVPGVCSNESICTVKPNIIENRLVYFCNCQGMMCNQNLTLSLSNQDKSPKNEVKKRQDTQETGKEKKKAEEEKEERISIVLILIPVTIIVIICLSVAYFVYRHCKRKQIQATTLTTFTAESSPNLDRRSIELVEIQARGQYGTVWRSQLDSEIVAIKVFQIQHKLSWKTEQEIFKLPRMDHEYILKFFGVTKRALENSRTEFWLITSYHEKGSLYDHLMKDTVTWAELCKITESMAKGLMHLHEEIFPDANGGYKPAVAHRDFKSQNVLLKLDMSACIADFGLALIFDPNNPPTNIHGQIGTRRYMAPEVLEGSINFSRDSFVRIDMYAFGLVLWELVSQCTSQSGPTPEYKLPFEVEMKPNSTLEQWQEYVVHKKNRPLIPETWRTHSGLSFICESIEEAWDDDAEARVTAACVVERISALKNFGFTNSAISIVEGRPKTPIEDLDSSVN